jgi:hypothetical protein
MATSPPSKAVGLDFGIVAARAEPSPLTKPQTFPVVEGAPVRLMDFTVAFQLNLTGAGSDDAARPIVSLRGEDGDLVFTLKGTQALEAKMGASVWSGKFAESAVGRPLSVALCVKRNGRQGAAGLWLDGVEQASGVLKSGVVKLKSRPLTVVGGGPEGTVSDLVVYDRALEREDVLALALRGQPGQKLEPFATPLTLADHECIAVLGGSEAVALMEDGTLETLLQLASPGKDLRMRSLAWETDTVWRQDRPLNFGHLAQQLKRVEATAVMLIFGRQECLERGEGGLTEFRRGLEEMLRLCRQQTPRLWLVTPARFEASVPPRPDLNALNPLLARYQDVITEVARSLHLPVTPPMPVASENIQLTTDGLNLAPAGIHQYAIHIASLVRPESLAGGEPASELLAQVRAKNQLWHGYWRPSNWAFLYGDRTAQPSSRDHLNPEVRWFPTELEQYRALIDAKEKEIWATVAGPERRVP